MKANDGLDDMSAFWVSSSLREELNRFAQECGYPTSSESRLLYRLCEGLAKGTLTQDTAVRTLRPLLDDRYALVGLDALNLRIAPMVYASQDYSNQMGQAYATFVSTVSKQVTRQCDVRSYGPFLAYSASVKGARAFEGADALAREFDGRIDVVDLTPHPDAAGQYQVTFQSPLDIDTLKELLGQLAGGDGRVLLESLVQLPSS